MELPSVIKYFSRDNCSYTKFHHGLDYLITCFFQSYGPWSFNLLISWVQKFRSNFNYIDCDPICVRWHAAFLMNVLMFQMPGVYESWKEAHIEDLAQNSNVNIFFSSKVGRSDLVLGQVAQICWVHALKELQCLRFMEQGCHSSSTSIFPDFSLTFPWHFTVFHTLEQMKKIFFLFFTLMVLTVSLQIWGLFLKERMLKETG